LAEAIPIATTNGLMRERAVLLGEKIRLDNGIKNAVEIISGYLG
jgi:hypothetical protein